MPTVLPSQCCAADSFVAKLGRVILALAVLGLLAAVLQKYSCWGLTERRLIPSEKIKAQHGQWVWSLRKTGFSEAEAERAILFENGVAAFNKAKNRRQLDRGAGWYRVKDRTLRFTPPDGSDPTTNGKTYELEVLMEVRDKVWWILAGTVLIGLILMRGRVLLPISGIRIQQWWQHIPLWMKVSGFFIFFLVVRWWQLHDSTYNDGVMSLQGVPGSDASGWHEMSRALAEGRGFDSAFSGQRPFYSLLLALFHQIFGSKIWVSLSVNCLLQAMAGTAVLVLGMSLGSRLIGLTVAFWMLLCPTQVGLTQVVLTENIGAAFGVMAVLMFWKLLRDGTISSAFLAGLITGMGNLASGVFLLTVPLYPILLVLVAWWQKWPIKKIITIATVFCAAVCLLFIPWMTRQKIVHGAFTQSLNSAELLYGGAHPEEKKLTSKLHQQAQQDGYPQENLGPRYHYFMTKYVDLVKENPERYLKQLGSAFEEAVQHTPRSNPVWQWLIRSLVILLGIGLCVKKGFFLPAIPIALALLTMHHVDTLPGVESFAIAAGVVLATCSRQTRVGWVIVIVTTLSFLTLAALSGNVAVDRFQATGDWLLFVLWSGGWIQILVKSSDGLDWLWAKWIRPGSANTSALKKPQHQEALDLNSSTNMPIALQWQGQGWSWIARVSWCWILLGMLAVGVTSAAYGWRKSHPPIPQQMLTGSTEKLLHHVQSHHPEPQVKTLPVGVLRTHLVRIDDFSTYLKANQDLNSMTRTYEKRGAARWVIEARRMEDSWPESGRVLLQIPHDLEGISQGQPLVVIGVPNPPIPGKFGHDMSLFEVLAYAPAKELNQERSDSNPTPARVFEPDMQNLRWVNFQPEVEDAVQRLTAVPASP